MSAQYAKGFRDGLFWCARCMRLAALQVEKPIMRAFTKQGSEATIQAIAKTGNVGLAAALRDIANEIEKAAKETQNAESGEAPVERVHEAPPDGGQQKR